MTRLPTLERVRPGGLRREYAVGVRGTSTDLGLPAVTVGSTDLRLYKARGPRQTKRRRRETNGCAARAVARFRGFARHTAEEPYVPSSILGLGTEQVS